MLDYGKQPDSNFVVTYGETLKNFNFKEITTKSDFYFNEIDVFSKKDFSNFNFQKITLPNAYVVGGVGNAVIGSVFYLAIYGVPILIGIIALIIIIFLYKKFIRKKKE